MTVESTAFSAIHSKTSLYRNKYIPHAPLVDKTVSRAPLINYGYYARYQLIRDQLPPKCDVMINLGCGMEDPNSLPIVCTKWIDADLPENITAKQSKMPTVPFEYHLETINLTHYKETVSTLSKHTTSNDHVCLLAECVFVYCNPKRIDNLLYALKHQLPYHRLTLIVFEQTVPFHSQFTTQMLKHFSQIAPLKGLSKYQSLQDHFNRYNQHWPTQVGNLHMWHSKSSLDFESLQQIELCNEFEELCDFMKHYIIIVADSHGPSNCPSITKWPVKTLEPISCSNAPVLDRCEVGHSTCQFSRQGSLLAITVEGQVYPGPTYRKHFAHTMHNGRVYVQGGITSRVFDDFYAFDLHLKQWQTLPSFKCLYRHSMCVYQDQIHLFGAHCGRFDTKWTHIGTHPWLSFALTVKDKVYLHGGISLDLTINDQLHTFDGTLQYHSTHSKRFSHHLVVNDGLVFLGGVSSDYSTDVDIHSPHGVYGARLSGCYPINCSLYSDATLQVMGGMGTCFSFKTHRNPKSMTFPNALMCHRIPIVVPLAFPLVKKEQVDLKKVIIHRGTRELDFVKRNYAYETMPYSDFLGLLDKEGVYLRALHEKQPFRKPVDARTFNVPFPELPLDIHSVVWRVGSELKLWGHYDLMDNLLMVHEGEKWITLYPPEDYARLDMEGTCSRLVPWTHRSPIQLRQGDCLYIPSGWIHFVENKTVTSSVNCFFRHLPKECFPKDCYGGGDLKGFQKAEALLVEAMEALKTSGADERLMQMYKERLLRSLE